MEGIPRAQIKNLCWAGDSVNLDSIANAAGAGLDATKICLEGTRTDLLAEIVDWICSAEPDCPRVFWLHGQAGNGKSVIAHTITSWLKQLGGLGSCFCFTRDGYAERRHEKLFTTIAHDLADCDPMLKRALAGVLASDHSLRASSDVLQQWQKLILQPLSKLSRPFSGPIVIIIDALDESGAEESRRNILRILASEETSNLPTNIRILLTSRPLPDMHNALHNAKCVMAKSIDDIAAASAYRDISLYISDQLHGLSDIYEEQVAILAQRSGSLFEWARLACEFIRSQKTGSTPKERYNSLISHGPGDRGEELLNDMYHVILRDIVGPKPKALARFRSVMHQILCTMESLPMDSLITMRRNFRKDSDRYDVEVILKPMASLLSGITDPSCPIRPLHTSFYEFLIDASRSKEFFVGTLDMHIELAYSALHVLQNDLHFNICGLESSYVRNSDVMDLAYRIKDNISPHLSYSCRHWVGHLCQSPFDSQVAKEVERLFKSERTLFWLEALSLLRELDNVHMTLDSVIRWVRVSKPCVHIFHIDSLSLIRTRRDMKTLRRSQRMSCDLLEPSVALSLRVPHIYTSLPYLSPPRALSSPPYFLKGSAGLHESLVAGISIGPLPS